MDQIKVKMKTSPMERIILYCSVGLQVLAPPRQCGQFVCSGSLLIALPQGIPAWFSISRWIQWIRVWVAVSILRFSQGSKSAKNTSLRGPSPWRGGRGAVARTITPQKKSNRIRLPSIPAKERMAKAKDPKARGIGKSITLLIIEKERMDSLESWRMGLASQLVKEVSWHGEEPRRAGR